MSRLWLSVLLLALPLLASASPPPLFVPDKQQGETEAPTTGRLSVQLKRQVFDASSRPGDLLASGLPGDDRLVRFERRVERDDGLTTWIGRIETDRGPEAVVFTLGKGLSFGRIPGKDGRAWQIESRGGRTWLVDPDHFIEPFGPDVVLPPPPDKSSRERRRLQESRKAHGSPVIDVLVVYTAPLVELWGSDALVRARIAHLEALSNQAYLDSDAGVHIRVVAMHLVDYPIRNDNDQALQDIRTPSSKPIKVELDRLRDQYGADLVAMLRHFDRHRQTSCGIASLLGYRGGAFDAAAAFSVTADRGFGREACGEWTFTHELGHNMGATHDIETEEGDYGAYPYSRGHRQTLDPQRGFATIMAYTTGPQARIGRLSNPRQTACMGQACGVDNESDNARGIGQAAAILAAFRPARDATQPGLRVSDVWLSEGSSGFSQAVFTVSLDRAAPGPVRFGVFTSNGTAIANGDYVSLSRDDLVIPAGQTSLQVAVQVRGDGLVEPDEHFALNLRDVEGAVVHDGQGVATIATDEPIPVLSVRDAEVLEGNSGTTDVVFTVTLSQPSTGQVGFEAQTHGFAPGDFSATEGTDFAQVLVENLVVPVGATSAQFTVPAFGDTQPEENERFYVSLSHVSGALPGDDFAVATLIDDDGGPSDQPRLDVGNATVVEGNAGQVLLRFPVRLTQAAPAPVTLDLRTVDNSAFAGSDYLAREVSGLRFEPGQVLRYFDVPVLGDTAIEPNETVVVVAENVAGARPTRPRGFGSIVNDDLPDPPLAARDDRFVLRENAGEMALHVLANDDLPAALSTAGSLQIITSPQHGSASIDTAGTPAGADDRIRYTPAPNRSGSDSLRYRLCTSAGSCSEATVRLVVRPREDVTIAADASAGFQDTPLSGLRPLPDLRFPVSAFVAPVVRSLEVSSDPSPGSPWDEARAGTAAITQELPAGPAGRWRIVLDLQVPGGVGLDLLAGIDGNGNGQADPDELACVSAMRTPVARCELEVDHPGTAAPRIWALAHNRTPRFEQARLDVFLVPPGPGEGLVATGPGRLGAGEAFTLRLGWRDHGLLPDESRLAYVDVQSAGSAIGSFPVRVDRINPVDAAIALIPGQPLALRLRPGAAQERIFIDVPAGASTLDVLAQGSPDIDLYLAPAPAPASSPGIAAAPPRAQAVASAQGAGGNTTVALAGGALTPGRWYVTPVNRGAGTASLTLTASLAGAAPLVRPGSYFNADRSGHGVFLYPAGSQWAGLWYTYRQDGTPTWYYLQGPAPGANGLWAGALYRAAWNGSGNHLVEVGRGSVAPTGADAFVYTYELDGQTGSEPMAALGRGCPQLAGQPLDASSHWFDPVRAGTGYSLQLFPAYEYFAAFVYDGQGQPRFLTAERNGFGGAEAVLALEQLTGFCPLCERTGAPQRADIGTLRRRFDASGLLRMELDAVYVNGVPGSWTANDAVQLLGGPGTTQGCSVD